MPDPPDYKPRDIPTVPMAQQATVAFAELNCKTNFSFLQGASHPDELVNRAGKLEYRALAITENGSLAGWLRA